MIKVESDMLVLDSSFTKEDVEAINYFVALAEKRVKDRILALLEEMPYQVYSGVATGGKILDSITTPKVLLRDDVIALIKGENK